MSYATRALAVASALLMGAPTAVLSHTNSIGYVGDGQGGVTFWYGNWHPGTTFNEAELKLQGANGTNYTPIITKFTLLQGSTPAGLIPATNYFTSNGTQLVGYDTNIQTSSTWQGVTFTGLSSGDYTFTYIPLGDAESYCTSCYPTANWAPMDQIIRSYTVTLSSAILSGDANLNGIPDIQEFGTVVTPSAPTLVSSNISYNVSVSTASLAPVTQTTIERTPTENGGKQRINFHATTNVTTTYVTTTTTTPVTTDTYSDNSTVVSNGTAVVTTSSADVVATSHNYADFYGRIDQYDTLDKVNNSINGLLDHEPSQTKEKFRVFSNNHYIYSYADGYTASSTAFGGGFEYDIKPTWTVGAQYNKVNIDLLGVDSISSQKKDHIGVFNALYSKWTTLNTNFGYAKNTYKVGRTVEYVFYNQSEPKGNEWWLHNRLYVHPTTGVSPYIGYRVGQFNRDGYTEIGSIQSARTVDTLNQTNHTGEVGLKLEHKFGKFGVSVDGSYATDNVASASASINYNEMIFIEGNYDTDGTVSNASGAAKVKFRF